MSDPTAPRTAAGLSPLRKALQDHGWYMAGVVEAEWIESSEWEPVLRAAIEAEAAAGSGSLTDKAEAADRCPWITSTNHLSYRCGLQRGHALPHEPIRARPTEQQGSRG